MLFDFIRLLHALIQYHYSMPLWCCVYKPAHFSLYVEVCRVTDVVNYYCETFARKMISLSGQAKTHGMREFMLINDRLSTILTQHAGEGFRAKVSLYNSGYAQ